VNAARAAVAALLLTGCASSLELNRRDDLLGSEPLPDLAATPPAALATARDDEPSLRRDTLDRSSWETTTVTVATGQVERQSGYVSPWRTDGSTARARGEAPSEATVLEAAGEPGSLAFEGLVQPLQPATDLVVSPARVVMQPPWTVVRGPDGLVYVRPAPAFDLAAWTAGVPAPTRP